MNEAIHQKIIENMPRGGVAYLSNKLKLSKVAIYNIMHGKSTNEKAFEEIVKYIDYHKMKKEKLLNTINNW